MITIDLAETMLILKDKRFKYWLKGYADFTAGKKVDIGGVFYTHGWMTAAYDQDRIELEDRVRRFNDGTAHIFNERYMG